MGSQAAATMMASPATSAVAPASSRRRVGQPPVTDTTATPTTNMTATVAPAVASDVTWTAVARNVPARPMNTAGPA